jgi:hypothetical protein
MGREETCEMLAIRDSSVPTHVVYTRCSVIDASRDLPDGNYTVFFNGYTVSARKSAGLWMPGEDTACAPSAAQMPRTLPDPAMKSGESVEILPGLRTRVA